MGGGQRKATCAGSSMAANWAFVKVAVRGLPCQVSDLRGSRPGRRIWVDVKARCGSWQPLSFLIGGVRRGDFGRRHHRLRRPGPEKTGDFVRVRGSGQARRFGLRGPVRFGDLRGSSGALTPSVSVARARWSPGRSGLESAPGRSSGRPSHGRFSRGPRSGPFGHGLPTFGAPRHGLLNWDVVPAGVEFGRRQVARSGVVNAAICVDVKGLDVIGREGFERSEP